jgi:peptidoglycan/LPS O-acetylase OafA/YrhL
MKTGTLSFASFVLAAVTISVYWIINHLHFDQGIKWWLFDMHIVSAFLGVLSGGWGLMRRNWICAICFAVCAYFIYIQLIAR